MIFNGAGIETVVSDLISFTFFQDWKKHTAIFNRDFISDILFFVVGEFVQCGETIGSI